MGSDYICKCPSGIKGRHCEIGELRQKALINFMLKSNYVTRSNIAPPKLGNNRYIFAKVHTRQERWEKKRERGDTGGVGGGGWGKLNHVHKKYINKKKSKFLPLCSFRIHAQRT